MLLLLLDTFCSETGQKICFDVSHSMMACNYYGWDLNDFINIVSKHIGILNVLDKKPERFQSDYLVF